VGVGRAGRRNFVRELSGKMENRKRSAAKDADRRAAASLRKRRIIWWTHFGFKGQFFRRSLGTSNRTKAKLEARKLIALAEAGKIQATTSSLTERKEQKRASLEKSHADPKMHAADVTRAKRTWAKAGKKKRKLHRERIKEALAPDSVRAEMSDRGKENWQRPGYRKRNTTAVKEGWASKRKRKKQSKTITAARARPEVKAAHLAGRLKSAAALLRDSRRKKNPGKRGPVPKPTEGSWFRIGSKIHEKIPITMRSDPTAVTAARKAYSEETRGRVSLEMCGSYHRRYVHWRKANPSVGLPESPSQ
jgi:hypothetical protein